MFIFLLILKAVKIFLWVPKGLSWWLSRKESTCQCRRRRVRKGREEPLEKEMATHPSTLAREMPWTEEPGRLQSVGSQSWT